MRDKHVDVMLFWGIIFIVMGHSYQLDWFFFPPYCFAVAFFFFISGYLFQIKETIKEKISFILKKIRKQLIPYFFINLAFGIVTVFLSTKGIILGGGLSFENLFIRPFIDGSQYYLNIPLWFLLNLFLVNVTAQLIHWKNTKKFKLIVFAILLPTSLFLVFKGLNHYMDFRLTIVRTGFALLFFHIGILFKEFKHYALKLLKNPTTVAILWVSVSLLKSLFGRIDYSILYGSVENKFFLVPLITTFFIICISYSICYYLSQAISDNSWIIKVGRKTFYIMALHLTVFFAINFCAYKLGRLTLAQFNTPYFFAGPKYFLVYLVPAIALPVLIGISIDKTTNWLHKFNGVNEHLNI